MRESKAEPEPAIFGPMALAARALALAISLAFSLPTVVGAQDGSADFAAAEVARRDGRLADAERLLRRSLEAEPRAETAFNLGAVLADLGRHREASATFAEVAEGAYGELSAPRARIVRERWEASRRAIAHVRVRVETARPVEVRIDGTLRGELTSTGVLTIDVDPGTRHVRVAARGWSVERVLELDGGDATSLEVRVPAPRVLTTEETPRRRRAVWIGVAAAAVAVGAAIAIGFAVRDPGTERVEDPVWGSVWTLRGTR